MSRFSAVDLSVYPIADILDVQDFEAYLARDRAQIRARIEALRITQPDLPEFDTLELASEPVNLQLHVAAAREMRLRALINDKIRQLSLAGATDAGLDHIGLTYYRTLRREITPADGPTPAVMEDNETYRQRLALAPESWSTAGPEGAYLFHALSASGDVLDVAAYSEDEGVCLAPQIRVVVLSRTGDGTASPELIETVRTALRREDLRPMGDLVTVESAEPFTFDIAVTLRIRGGASAAPIVAAAEKRIRTYAEGRFRFIGDGIEGPTMLVGRTLRYDTLNGHAQGGDPNIIEVDVTTPAVDINAAAPGYAAALPLPQNAVAALASPLTAHLFKAPRLGTITITTEVMSGGWS